MAQEIRKYRKVRETPPDKEYGVIVPVGYEMRVSQEEGAQDMQIEGFVRVHEIPSGSSPEGPEAA